MKENTTPIRYFEISLLYNFSADKELIDLGEGISIKKISREKIERSQEVFNISLTKSHENGYKELIIALNESYGPASMNDNTTLWFVEYIGKDIPEDLEWGAIVKKVLTALRLFRGGRPHKIWRICGKPSGTNYVYGHNASPGLFGPAHNIHLSEKETEDFLSFWKRFRESDDKYLRIALNRFNSGLERSDLEEMLLDFMIGIESVYSKGESSEITYKIAMRAAFLIGQENKKYVFERLKKAYNIRSRIVHGSPLKNLISYIDPNKKSTEPDRIDLYLDEFDFVFEIGDYLRKSILKILDMTNRMSKEEIDDYLDINILESQN